MTIEEARLLAFEIITAGLRAHGRDIRIPALLAAVHALATDLLRHDLPPVITGPGGEYLRVWPEQKELECPPDSCVGNEDQQ